MVRHSAQIISILLASLLISCASDEVIDATSAEGAFKLAQKYEENSRFEEAIAQYQTLKNKYPYSKFAIEAELKVADISFEREAFIEAEAAYKLFKEFHPRHPKVDYVTFRLAMSIFRQLPATIDRDLSLANNAIYFFEDVYKSYPTSDYAGSARDHKGKILRMLAKKQNYIAEFYFTREKYDSALGRYKSLLNKYPGAGYDAKALYGATMSAYHLKEKQVAKTYYDKLKSLYPKSKETLRAKKEVGDEL